MEVCLSVSICKATNDIDVSIQRFKPIVSIKRLNPINVVLGLICSVSKNVYLQVAPTVIWLTPDTIEEQFDITSNTKWIIN